MQNKSEQCKANQSKQIQTNPSQSKPMLHLRVARSPEWKTTPSRTSGVRNGFSILNTMLKTLKLDKLVLHPYSNKICDSWLTLEFINFSVEPRRIQNMGLPHVERETDVEKAGLEFGDSVSIAIFSHNVPCRYCSKQCAIKHIFVITIFFPSSSPIALRCLNPKPEASVMLTMPAICERQEKQFFLLDHWNGRSQLSWLTWLQKMG